MKGYSCTRKDFLKELETLVKEGFLRQIIEEKNIFYELNLMRFKMEKYI
jgi:hypothetical protein